MPLLTLTNITHSYGSHLVLDGATMSMDPGQKVGLVGRNGSGKTTLMRVIRGEIAADSGSMQVMKSARVGYLAQDPAFDPQETVRDVAEGAFAELHELHVQLNHVFDEMAGAEGDALDRLLRKQVQLEAAIETAGGYAIDHRIEATLHGLGFADDQFKLKTSVLSGGQRNRLGLARLLLEAPDLLLLDEPTNHLDIVGREWLESFLIDEYTGAVLVVSHDRWMLDRVVSRIVEVERGRIREYPGNYHKYVELRRERMLTDARVYEKQRDRIRSEEQFIAKYKAGQRAKQARGRLSRLERFKRDELVEKPMELESMRLRLQKVERSGDIVVAAENLSKRYDDLTLFEDLSLVISRGERVGVVGPNGAGKSTLVKCLLGELEVDEGVIQLGARVNPGHFRQTHEHLDLDLLVYQYVQSAIVSADGEARASEQQARDLAGAFLFSGAEQEKPLQLLSGGERSRAVLAALIGSAFNLLILDEPTNHLDIPSAERLEQALSRDGGYGGTLIVITHDRALLDATCDRLIVFEGEGRVRDFAGSWSEYLERKDQLAETEPREPQQDSSRKPGAAKARRVAAVKQREAERERNPYAAMSTSKLETRIEEVESGIRTIDAQLIDPEVYVNHKKCRHLQAEREALASQLEPLIFEWSRRADEA